MSATLLAETAEARVFHADWRALLGLVRNCDLLLVDSPYSERTHSGHGTVERWGVGLPPTYDGGERREINYEHWGAEEIAEFVGAWSPVVRGWFVTVTDDELAPIWRASLDAAGRYAFAPLPFVAPGSRVRLAGDGPSCWTTWIVVARPRTREFSRWGTLPGAYVLPEGCSERMPIVGGKPTWLTRALIRDYSRPGDLVCDPCCGAGSTLVGAIREGRRAVGGDVNREHAEMAAKWIGEAWAKNPERAHKQPPLFGGAA